MKKSVIFAFIILLAVIGWFLTGTISIGDENPKDQSDIQNIDEDNEDINTKNNSLKVESKIIHAEEIDQSITLQGQTIHNRTIDVKSETTGNIINMNYKRGKIVKADELLLEISIENRRNLLNSHVKELERINKKF